MTSIESATAPPCGWADWPAKMSAMIARCYELGDDVEDVAREADQWLSALDDYDLDDPTTYEEAKPIMAALEAALAKQGEV